MQIASRQFFRLSTLWLAVKQVILFGLALIIPKRHNLWVFGSKRGYGDGPAQLAEYCAVNHPELHVTWLLSKGQTPPANDKGIEFIYYGTIAWYRACLAASVAVYAFGLRDVGGTACWRAFVVYLGHGTPIKRIGLDRWRGSARDYLNMLGERAIGHNLGLVPVSCKTTQQRMASAFDLDTSKVPVVGDVRSDFLYCPEQIDSLSRLGREQLSLDNGERAVLWAPTWRPGKPALPAFSENEIKKLVELLGFYNALLFVRPHPNLRGVIGADDGFWDKRIRLMEPNKFPSLNNILPVFDVLVTDYSSVSIDYSILQRPIVFFSHDLETYNEEWGLYESFDRFCGGDFVKDVQQFLNALEGALMRYDDAYVSVKQIYERFHDSYADGHACERVASTIMEAQHVSL